MQDIDRVGKLGDIDHAECSIHISNPNLSHTLADAIHRLPVVRVHPLLHLEKLVTRFSPRRSRKAAKVVQRSTAELDRLRALDYSEII